MNATMEDIELKAKVFAGARAELAERLGALREEHEAAKRRRLQGIKNALDRVRGAHDELHAAVEDNPALFDKPKTRILHGIRVGWMKQRGKLGIADPATFIAALRKLLGLEEAKAYIKTTETPIAAALAALPAKDLAKCGATLSDDVDAVLIKAADSDLDKLIDALVSDPELEALR